MLLNLLLANVTLLLINVFIWMLERQYTTGCYIFYGFNCLGGWGQQVRGEAGKMGLCYWWCLTLPELSCIVILCIDIHYRMPNIVLLTLLWIAIHYNTLLNIVLHCLALPYMCYRYIALHCQTLAYIVLHCPTLPYICYTSRYIAKHCQCFMSFPPLSPSWCRC